MPCLPLTFCQLHNHLGHSRKLFTRVIVQHSTIQPGDVVMVANSRHDRDLCDDRADLVLVTLTISLESKETVLGNVPPAQAHSEAALSKSAVEVVVTFLKVAPVLARRHGPLGGKRRRKEGRRDKMTPAHTDGEVEKGDGCQGGSEGVREEGRKGGR